MKLLFKLTMPNVGSWNGKWTGENNNRLRTREVSKSKATEVLGEKEVNDFYYDFGDGWGLMLKSFLMLPVFIIRK